MAPHTGADTHAAWCRGRMGAYRRPLQQTREHMYEVKCIGVMCALREKAYTYDRIVKKKEEKMAQSLTISVRIIPMHRYPKLLYIDGRKLWAWKPLLWKIVNWFQNELHYLLFDEMMIDGRDFHRVEFFWVIHKKIQNFMKTFDKRMTFHLFHSTQEHFYYVFFYFLGLNCLRFWNNCYPCLFDN